RSSQTSVPRNDANFGIGTLSSGAVMRARADGGLLLVKNLRRSRAGSSNGGNRPHALCRFMTHNPFWEKSQGNPKPGCKHCHLISHYVGARWRAPSPPGTQPL